MRGWMKVRVPKDRRSTRERLYGNAAVRQPPPIALGMGVWGPRSGMAWLYLVWRSQISMPLQSGSASRRRTPSQQQMPRCAPSHPCSASGTRAGLCPTMSPGHGAMLSPHLPCFAGAGPAAFQSRPLATPTQPTSSSRGSPTHGCHPLVLVKSTASRWRAQPGASSARDPLGRESLCPQRNSDGASSLAVCHGAHPMATHSAPPVWASRRDPNRPSW